MKEKVSGIYEIMNLENGKVYIGSSTDIYQRISTHKSSLRGKYHINRHLQNAWDKYGESSFSFKILECILINDLNYVISREQSWIDKFDSHDREYGYNILTFAYSSRGYNHSYESRKKIANSQLGELSSNTNLTNEDVIEIKNMLKDGISSKYITEKFQISTSNLSNIKTGRTWSFLKVDGFNENSLNFKGESNPSSKLSVNDVKKIKTLIINGKTNVQIAKDFNVKAKTISSIRTGKRWNDVFVEGFIPKVKKSNEIKLNENDVLIIKELLKIGVKQKEIAIKFNVSPQTINGISKNRIWSQVKST